MLKQHIYYALKPFLPWRVKTALRGFLARRKRERCRSIWPINESAATPPAGWPGWPEQKQFAFVLTHDVENQSGLDKCQALAEVEMSLGFRSSFNLVPEGEYSVPAALREWLIEHGFEVGVHDHKHDGKLFASEKQFRQGALRINHYLKSWGAVGFRGGFMLRNLNWIHDLNLQYDASTFDTDPFEMQSEGSNTIFPFWVPPPAGDATRPDGASASASYSNSPRPRQGYLELPYTLAQDSTLFLVLGEKSPDVWLQKVDWLAERGGMALVNVHPDYIQFEGEKPSAKTYPLSHYRRLLEHVRDRHAGNFWQPLARQLAEVFSESDCKNEHALARQL